MVYASVDFSSRQNLGVVIMWMVLQIMRLGENTKGMRVDEKRRQRTLACDQGTPKEVGRKGASKTGGKI